ncbi:MAG: PspC protein [Marmoricola sp.]|nr:PspC protein [Marmoricola sp.]
MSETSTGPSADPGPAPAPPPPPPPPTQAHQDLDRLRRSVSDRYIAGVAGGIGRHFGIDPTIVRVLLAVTTLFGGAGALVYAVCWVFVPEDGSERAAIQVGSEPRKILLLAAAVVAFLIAMGDAFSGFNLGWPIASIAVVIGVVLIARDRRNEHRGTRVATYAAAPGYDTATVTAPVGDPLAYGAPAAPTYVPTYVPPAPPAWQPPVARGPLIPPRPKRTGILWFFPTLALIAIGLGALGIIDSSSTHVVPAAYPALAIAITGVMLVVGAFTGRPGGLILIGMVATFALAVATVVGGFHLDGRDIHVAPASSATVASSYTAHNGRIVLDLSQLADPESLAGRTIHLRINAGQIKVIVPASMSVDIKAKFGFAGGISVPGYDGGGVQDSVSRHLTATTFPPTDDSPVHLDISASVGQITVEQVATGNFPEGLQ